MADVDNNEYVAYTDGSCDNIKTRFGGSAYVLLQNGIKIKEASKGFTGVTNNQMELLAIISAVNSVPEGSRIVVYSDSLYSINCLDGTWSPKKNMELIELFKKCSRGKTVVFHWVRGHSGNFWNEYVDKLAYEACMKVFEEHGLECDNKYV